MSVQVASLFGTLKLHDEDWKRGIREAKDDSRSVGDSLKSMGASVRNVGIGMTLATAPLVAFGVAGIGVASSFDATFTEISARTGIVGDDLDMLKNTAIKWGADTVFSAQQSADAFLQLLTTGMSTTDAITTMESVLTGAAASGLDLGTTADKLTNIMAGMKLPVEDASTVIDMLGRASGVVGGDMASLMEAMESGAGAAKTFGIEYEELIPLLAIWSDAGIRGSEAGTQLRSMLTSMTADTSTARDAWARLGTSMYDAEGNMRPLDDVLGDIREGLATMTEEDQSRTLKDLAGAYGLTGLSALLASDGIDAMNEKMEGAASAGDIADANMGTFGNTVDSLMGSIEALQITALTPLMNDVLQPLINDYIIPAVNAFRDWAAENPELANAIIIVTAAVAGLGVALTAVGIAMGVIGGVIGVIASPVGLLIGAIAALGVLIVTQWEDNIKPALQALYDWFVVNALPGINDFIENTAKPIIEGLFNFIGGVWDTIQPGLESLYNWFVTDALPAIKDFIENTVQPIVEGFFGIIGGVWDSVSTGLGDLYDWFMVSALPAIKDFIENTINPAIQGFVDLLTGIWTTVSPFLEDLKTGIDNVFSWINDNVIKPFTDMISGIGDTINGLLETLGLVESKTQTAQGYMSGGDAADSAGNFMFGGARAGGGEVIGGGAYLVGEQGPELFVPGASGAIVPNGAGGGQQIRFEAGSVTIRANSEAEGRAAARGFGEELAMIMGEMG